MNPVSIAATVITGLVSTGAGAVVGNAIKASTPANATLVKKVALGVGGLALSSLTGAAAARHTGEKIGETLDEIQQVRRLFSKKKDS